MAALVAARAAASPVRGDAGVFGSEACAYAERLPDAGSRESAPEANVAGVLRTLSVEERAGEDRRTALVRAPIFFAAGECRSLDELALVAAEAPAVPLRWQADDVRHGPDGGISRLHVWFAVDLPAHARRRYLLVHRPPAAAVPPAASMVVHENADTLEIETEAGPVVFGRDGRLRSIAAAKATWNFGAGGLGPDVQLGFGPGKEAAERFVVDGKSAAATVRWAAGPVFTKLSLVVAGRDGARLEQDVRIPRAGGEIVITSAVFPGERAGGKLERDELLSGCVGSGCSLVETGAGVRPDLRREHGYTVNGLVNADGATLLAVPLVPGGSNGRWTLAAGDQVRLSGFSGVKRERGEQSTLRAFWTEVRLVPVPSAEPEAVWSAYRARLQPLVAVVDQPGVALAQLHTALQQLADGMKPVNWAQEAGRFDMNGSVAKRDAVLARRPTAADADADRLLRGAEAAWAKLSGHGRRRLREDEKSRASGPLNPYHITYTLSAGAALQALGHGAGRLTEANEALAGAARRFLGRTDPDGSPYIDCFSRALNMQMGPMLFGLTSARAGGDAGLGAFYRDLATSPVVLAVAGRGVRPYTGTRTKGNAYSDYLYQAICDFWLRAAELLANEDLQLHPLAYARYTDCIDVLADRYHAVDARDKDGTAGAARANFFRGQGHTHRWLGWSCAPFIRLLEDPGERAQVGLTEAVYYTRSRIGRWNNWPDLTFYILADLLTREALPHYERPRLPARPAGVSARAAAAGVELTWEPVAGARGYRVFRGDAKTGAWRWLDSPYLSPAPAPTVKPRFTDPEGRPGARYLVLAVDAQGRASAWPEDRAGAVVATGDPATP